MRSGNQGNASTGQQYAFTFSGPYGSTGPHFPPSTTPEIAYTVNCKLEFDGACRGLHGPAGAGAILRDDLGRVYRFRQGLGCAPQGLAAYRAYLLGLRKAVEKGYQNIRVQGDSLFVCNQVQGLTIMNAVNFNHYIDEAKRLRNTFLSFEITHVSEEFNTEADYEAKMAINLPADQVQEAKWLID